MRIHPYIPIPARNIRAPYKLDLRINFPQSLLKQSKTARVLRTIILAPYLYITQMEGVGMPIPRPHGA